MSAVFLNIDRIKAFVFDVDGVFTDSTILITESGEFLRSMNVRDGYAVKVALAAGFKVGIITGGSSEGVTKRFKGLGIEHIYSRSHDKLPDLHDLLLKWNLEASECVYMGDDEIDRPCLEAVGLACCPKDADLSVRDHVDYICQNEGGRGCVREVVQMVMEAQNKWRPQR